MSLAPAGWNTGVTCFLTDTVRSFLLGSAADTSLDLATVASTLEGEEVCPAELGLDDWTSGGNGIGVTTFELVRDNVVAWNGEPLGPAPLPPCDDAGQFATAMDQVTAECCDEPSEVRSASAKFVFLLLFLTERDGDRSATRASRQHAMLAVR